MKEALKRELEDGERLARQLAWHLLNMNAAEATIPVEAGGREFEVIVRLKPESTKPDKQEAAAA